METKKSKYDTNPLDPDVQERSEEEWGTSDVGAPTGNFGGATQPVAGASPENSRQNVYSEVPTRRYDSEQGDTGYPSVFVPPTYAPPTQYQPAPMYRAPVSGKPTSRTIPGFGLPEKWAVMLAYAPFYVGLVVSLVELFLVPRKEGQVRFHASQAVALHIGILLVSTVFGVISTITDSSFGGFLFKLAAFIFLVISMARVWNGQPHRISPLAEPAQWFNEHIEPRNRG